jgi:S1-C subfamily serine protease
VLPTPAPEGPKRPSGFKQFVVGALVGALVGGVTAGGVVALTKDDGSSTSRTVVIKPTSGSGKNTSIVTRTGDIQSIVAKVEPAVVAIRTGGAVDAGLFESNGGSSGGAGTGFVVSSDGVIVTNNHVVEDAGGKIEVSFSDGTNLKAKVLGRSSDNDLAVLKVDATDLPTLKLGSSEQLQVGDDVVAIGNALALEGGLSVTQGIISQKGRTVPESETGATLYDVLQTDAAINPGNSGGPLVNSSGEVVGINTALAGDSQNVGFAISIDSAKPVIDELTAGRDVKAAFLGVYTQEVTPAVAKELDLVTKTGAVVVKLTPNAAAADAGLKANDVIVAVGSKPVARPDDVGAAIRQHKPGDEVEITVERDGKQQTIPVTLGTRPASTN